MKTDAPTILEFISSTLRTFTIPVYQRNYDWQLEHCEKLFNDLLESLETRKNHYFGNIVYYAISTNFSTGYSELALIDGQQRITTIMLLLAAIRDLEDDNLERNNITSTYLKNEGKEGIKEKSRVKLKQIETDRDVYEAIINGTFDSSMDGNAARNYKAFKKMVIESNKKTNELLEAINNLIVVALDLEINKDKEHSESPQNIFESINATGKKLSTADLIRNYLLLGIPDKEQEKYYKDYWLKIEKSIGNDNISDFINKYLVMKLSDKVYKDSEYATFKKYILKNNIDVKTSLEDLLHYSKYYSWIINPDNAIAASKKISECLLDLKELNTATMVPLLLLLLEKYEDDNIKGFNKDELIEALKTLESWTFRVRITNMITSGSYSTIVARNLINTVKRYDSQDYHAKLRYEISNYRTQDIWPSDSMFKESFMKHNFYKNNKNYVQRKLEWYVSNDRINSKPESIEHIMPETLNFDWEKLLGNNYKEIHAGYLHTIGNLTPMNQVDNSFNSNDLYRKKSVQYSASSWKLTRDVADKYSDWGKEEIIDRSEKLAKKALKIWQGPLKRERAIEAEIKKKDDSRTIYPTGNVCKTIFEIKKKDCDAKMRVSVMNDKTLFSVLAGSRIAESTIDNNIKSNLAQKLGWNGKQVLEDDISFGSPSGASCFVLNGHSDGWTEWISSDGITLDDVVAMDQETIE